MAAGEKGSGGLKGLRCSELMAGLQKEIWVLMARLSLSEKAEELGALVHPIVGRGSARIAIILLPQ